MAHDLTLPPDPRPALAHPLASRTFPLPRAASYVLTAWLIGTAAIPLAFQVMTDSSLNSEFISDPDTLQSTLLAPYRIPALWALCATVWMIAVVMSWSGKAAVAAIALFVVVVASSLIVSPVALAEPLSRGTSASGECGPTVYDYWGPWGLAEPGGSPC